MKAAEAAPAKTTAPAASPKASAPTKVAQPVALLHTLLAYAFSALDSRDAVLGKFLAFLALGPMTRADVEARLNAAHVLPQGDLNTLYAQHTQAYLKSSFADHDIYPLLALGAVRISPAQAYVILKDKAYKDLRPWLWGHYSPYERGLIIDNAHNALTRLGYLDTHPLRRRIVEKSPPQKNPVVVGGALLSSKKTLSASNTPLLHAGVAPPASPLSLSARRAATASPKLNVRRTDTSPLKDAKRKFVASLSLLSSEDEKQAKKGKREGKRSNSSGSSGSNASNASNITMNSMSGATSYTLPSSTEESQPMDEDHSDDEKPRVVISRPASVAAGDKKQVYYTQLAEKFRAKYQEYEKLHLQLGRGTRKGSVLEKRKQLMKLFELHSLLAEWKRKLWDYHNENSMAEGVMNLSKHRKTNSGSASTHASPFLAPDKFSKAHTSSPSVGTSDRFAKRKPEPRPRAKIALDY